MSNPLIKHYLIALLIGAVTFVVTNLIPGVPANVNASLSIVIAYFTHHYLENNDTMNPAVIPTDGGAPGAGSSPPGPQGTAAVTTAATA